MKKGFSLKLKKFTEKKFQCGKLKYLKKKNLNKVLKKCFIILN